MIAQYPAYRYCVPASDPSNPLAVNQLSAKPLWVVDCSNCGTMANAHAIQWARVVTKMANFIKLIIAYDKANLVSHLFNIRDARTTRNNLAKRNKRTILKIFN